jgi:hypothetical protein
VTEIIYAEDAGRYHANDGKTLGSTRIRDFMDHGPVWWRLRYIDGAIRGPETSDAMRQGSLLDCMMTEPQDFARRYVAKPEGMSFATKDGKAWRDAQPAGIEIVPAEWIAIAEDCVRAIGAHHTAADMLAHPRRKNQVTLRHALPNGLVLQSRPDFLMLDPDSKTGWYIDLKKTDDLDGFGRKAIDFGYHRQLAICQWLAMRAGYKIDAYLLAAEWQRGSRCRLFRMPEIALDAGWIEVKTVVDEIAQRFADDDWTDDDTGDVADLDIPDWMIRKMGGA